MAQQMRGRLEKRSSDGTWKLQAFSIHKHKLYYHDPAALKGPPRASLDLLDVVRTERVGNKLYLWIDEKRKHQLRQVENEPTLDHWEKAIHERIAIAKKRRRRPPPPLSPTQEERGPSEDKERGAFAEAKEDDRTIDRAFYRAQILDFYRRNNPDKIDDVDALIFKYSEIGINEKDLLAAIQNKYTKTRVPKY